jgi:hypothetical protein
LIAALRFPTRWRPSFGWGAAAAGSWSPLGCFCGSAKVIHRRGSGEALMFLCLLNMFLCSRLEKWRFLLKNQRDSKNENREIQSQNREIQSQNREIQSQNREIQSREFSSNFSVDNLNREIQSQNREILLTFFRFKAMLP